LLNLVHEAQSWIVNEKYIMKLSIPRDKKIKLYLHVFWITGKIIHLVIERFEIQSVVSFGSININDVAYEKFNNVSVYDYKR
jgi:hypothetical protein